MSATKKFEEDINELTEYDRWANCTSEVEHATNLK